MQYLILLIDWELDGTNMELLHHSFPGKSCWSIDFRAEDYKTEHGNQSQISSI
jgi:hypothetical protein